MMLTNTYCLFDITKENIEIEDAADIIISLHITCRF